MLNETVKFIRVYQFMKLPVGKKRTKKNSYVFEMEFCVEF